MYQVFVAVMLVGIAAGVALSHQKVITRMDEFNAALQALKDRIAAEKAEVLKAIEDLKNDVGTGLPKAEVISALNDLSTSIGNIFEPTPAEPPVG